MCPHLVQCDLKGMPEKRIGIRELKSTLSECVREVKSGRTIVVTEHGQAVARIIPEGISVREHVEALRQAGTIAPKRLRGTMDCAAMTPCSSHPRSRGRSLLVPRSCWRPSVSSSGRRRRRLA